MSELDSFLSEVKKEGSDPFEALEKETPSESATENEPETDKPNEGANTQEDNVPFHKHPRWVERENELKALRETNEATAKELAELREITEKVTQRSDPSGTIPDWFTELYGANEVAWKKYNEHEVAREQELRDKIIQEQDAQRQKQAQEAKYWNDYNEEQFKKLGDEIGQPLSPSDRNKLSKFLIENPVYQKDTNLLDFKKGWEFMTLL